MKLMTAGISSTGLEGAFAEVEARSDEAIQAAGKVLGCLKRLRAAAREGKCRELETSREQAGQVTQALAQAVSARLAAGSSTLRSIWRMVLPRNCWR